MLLLSRRIGERVFIGEDISVTIIGMNRNNIRIGIDAPDDITILREEVYNREKAQIEENQKKHYDTNFSSRPVFVREKR